MGLLNWLRRRAAENNRRNGKVFDYGNQSGDYGDEALDGEVNRSTRLRFEYVDRDGVVGVREVKDWIDTTFYVKGWCTDRRALRTFRKNQILRWISGDQALRFGKQPYGKSRF